MARRRARDTCSPRLPPRSPLPAILSPPRGGSHGDRRWQSVAGVLLPSSSSKPDAEASGVFWQDVLSSSQMTPQELNASPCPCRWCGGTGINNTIHLRHPGGACRACGGAGTLLVWRPPRPCPFCGGTGVDPVPNAAFRSIPCRNCSGTGWIDYLLTTTDE